jgi:hypothetical protein
LRLQNDHPLADHLYSTLPVSRRDENPGIVVGVARKLQRYRVVAAPCYRVAS